MLAYVEVLKIWGQYSCRCPINSVVPLLPLLSEMGGGHVPHQLYGAGACSGADVFTPALFDQTPAVRSVTLNLANFSELAK